MNLIIFHPEAENELNSTKLMNICFRDILKLEK